MSYIVQTRGLLCTLVLSYSLRAEGAGKSDAEAPFYRVVCLKWSSGARRTRFRHDYGVDGHLLSFVIR